MSDNNECVRQVENMFAFSNLCFHKCIELDRMRGIEINFKYRISFFRGRIHYIKDYVLNKNKTRKFLFENDDFRNRMYSVMNRAAEDIATVYKEKYPNAAADNLDNVETVLYFNNRLGGGSEW